MQRFNVIIIGGGVAASAAALPLTKAGQDVLMLEQSGGDIRKIGEALPPAAKPLLRDLGIWQQFTEDGHLPSYSNQSLWGSENIQYTDFLRSPHGNGWHLDRIIFDKRLRQTAAQHGVTIKMNTRTLSVQREANSWKLKTNNGVFHADWLIDASGRASWLTRQLGIAREVSSKLIAWVVICQQSENNDKDNSTLIESVENGWWYTARIPNDTRIVAYLSDSDLLNPRNKALFLDLLSQTKVIQKRIATYQIQSEPHAVDARTSRLLRFFGEKWLAVGDAAICVDPLSSQGLLNALYSGVKAADALLNNSPQNYDTALENVYKHFLQHYQIAYESEKRWQNSLFWQQRHKHKKLRS